MCLLQLDALPRIVRAVNGRCEVYIDGGIRTGSDVFKALALGARAVFVGRPIIYGLSYDVSQCKMCYMRFSIECKLSFEMCQLGTICCYKELHVK